MRLFFAILSVGFMVVAFAGCGNVSAPYIMDTERTDQTMNAGNRGYLKGTPPPADDRSGLKRKLVAVDIDLPEGTRKESAKADTVQVVEKRREVTVTREETPTTVKERIVVREEEIK